MDYLENSMSEKIVKHETKYLATREDLQATREDLQKEIGGVKTELQKEIQGVRVELQKEIEDVRVELQKVKSEIIKWMFIFWVGTMGTVIAIMKLL